MIEGFKIDVKGTELQALMRKRIERKAKRLGELETSLAAIPAMPPVDASASFAASKEEQRVARLIGMPTEMLGDNEPWGAIKPRLAGPRRQIAETARRFVEREKRAIEALTFIADHVVVGEVYRIEAPSLSGMGYDARALPMVQGAWVLDDDADIMMGM